MWTFHPYPRWGQVDELLTFADPESYIFHLYPSKLFIRNVSYSPALLQHNWFYYKAIYELKPNCWGGTIPWIKQIYEMIIIKDDWQEEEETATIRIVHFYLRTKILENKISSFQKILLTEFFGFQ